MWISVFPTRLSILCFILSRISETIALLSWLLSFFDLYDLRVFSTFSRSSVWFTKLWVFDQEPLEFSVNIVDKRIRMIPLSTTVISHCRRGRMVCCTIEPKSTIQLLCQPDYIQLLYLHRTICMFSSSNSYLSISHKFFFLSINVI